MKCRTHILTVKVMSTPASGWLKPDLSALVGLAKLHPARKPLAGLAALTVVFWIIGPPSYYHSQAAQIIRLAYSGLTLWLTWWACGALALRPSRRWLAVAAVALALKAHLFPYFLSDVDLSNLGGSPSSPNQPPSVLWRLARPILFVVVITVVLGWLRSRPATSAAATGYRPPVQWKYRSKANEEIHKLNASLKKDNSVSEAKPFDLLNADLFRERAAMPPCVVWYRPAELDEVTGKPEGLWVSVMDGNPALKQPGASPATYMQTLEIKGVASLISRQRLRLWSVDPDVIANLNRGPLRQEIVRATAYPSGKIVTFFLPMGAEGASMPLPLAEKSDVGGSSGKGTGASTDDAL